MAGGLTLCFGGELTSRARQRTGGAIYDGLMNRRAAPKVNSEVRSTEDSQ